MRAPTRVVIDTNVIVSALRSNRGTAYALLRLVETGQVVPILTVPLVFEYEEVLLRHGVEMQLSSSRISELIDSLCAVGEERSIYFLWRPFLRDPDDDLVLEAAVVGQCDYLVTFNIDDFAGAETLGVDVVRPGQLLKKIGVVP